MTTIGQRERATQNRVIQLFQQQLGYTYLGNWYEIPTNSNIDQAFATAYLIRQGYSLNVINKALFELKQVADNFSDDLYKTVAKLFIN